MNMNVDLAMLLMQVLGFKQNENQATDQLIHLPFQ